MDNIDLNGVTKDQLALYCATKIVSSAEWGVNPRAEDLSYCLTHIAKAALAFLNEPAQFRPYLKKD